MNYSFRIREDWLLLVVAILFICITILALSRLQWFLATASICFVAATIYMWHKQAAARWCVDCHKPMRSIENKAGVHAKLKYVCDSCGRINDSGIHLNRPE